MRRLLAFAILLTGASAAAQAPPSRLGAEAAQAIVAGCVAHATSKRQSHAIAVADTGGHIVAALRMDGNSYGIMDFAVAKAKAAAAWGFATAAMSEAATSTPGFAAAPHVITVGGGVPVFSADGRERLGAVGVSGEVPADDASCAAAGIRAAGLRPERAR